MYTETEYAIAVPAAAKTTVTAQPKSESMKMEMLTPQNKAQQHCAHNHTEARRLRGGGVAKDCFIGLVGCFLCFECCEGCCDCFADIICCPCEMCC